VITPRAGDKPSLPLAKTKDAVTSKSASLIGLSGPQVDSYPNYQYNPCTYYPQQTFEENEPPPPQMDRMSREEIAKTGQFLKKFYKPTPEEQERLE